MSRWKKLFIILCGLWFIIYKPFVAFNHPSDKNNVLSWVQFGLGLFVTILIIIYFLQNKKQKYEN